MASSTSIGKPNKLASILGENTKGKGKETIYKTLANVGVAVIGGSLATVVIGKPSFLVGLGLTGYGYYKDISWLAPLGIGMMASSHLVPNESDPNSSGFSVKQEVEDVKNRFTSLKESLLSKTYIDKIYKPKGTSNSSGNRTLEETTNGFGSVEANLRVLNQIEEQLVSSAMEIQNQRRDQTTQGVNDEMEGFNEQDFSGF
jgi:hypothetical protein